MDRKRLLQLQMIAAIHALSSPEDAPQERRANPPRARTVEGAVTELRRQLATCVSQKRRLRLEAKISELESQVTP
jgi:hypothetical protein